MTEQQLKRLLNTTFMAENHPEPLKSTDKKKTIVF